jgi:hypothetical protein
VKITASQAQPGDVVLVTEGSEDFPPGVYEAPAADGLTWSAMQPMGAFGTIPQPPGELDLIARDGKPA